ncbi:AsnC family transcriptional regulator [Methanococcoides methylutens]|uniref:AsnC family transcriptional regulator n=1 Tax=Methanococcoides methylutens TaxID=2226 RepID=A0A099T3J9_METMT|nr:AsnC family transcriptional regulator [Methanococcoides methylutens]KGK98778.1 AsnC family transcriptional regulator [Methanococcoides methylutens]
MEIEEKTLKLIGDSKDGVYQNELWKMLEIDSRKCSRVITKLMNANLIYRESAVNNGARTYLIKVVKPEEESFDLLLAGEMFSPCAGCRLACQPEICELLSTWINQIKMEDEVEKDEE